MSPDEAYEKVLEHLRADRRTTFLPGVVEEDSPDPVSKFGGRPWLPSRTAWPICPGCQKPMQFWVQLDVASLPGAAGVVGAGLIQLFACTADAPKQRLCLTTYEHDSRAALVRLIDATQAGANAAPPAGREAWPARRIVAWQPRDDYMCDRDVVVTDGEDYDALLELMDLASGSDRHPWTHDGDKLGGWPDWVQGAEYGECRICGARMNAIFQIASEENLPYMLGDLGIGHISQCPEHPQVLTWGWACS